MRDMTYTPRALCRAAGLSETETEHALTGVGSMRLLRWVSRNMVRTVEDCPTCGAVTDGGELHGDTCEHGRCGACGCTLTGLEQRIGADVCGGCA